ncbi:MAG: BREX-3 system P-loop-containing protein BrxF [Chloroflexi bacterium]|nr:BREX-3 system P-loop-containing protein BrxF [Chloroflexota bacterium]
MRSSFGNLAAELAAYQCILMVHTDVRRLREQVREIARVYNWPFLSVGRELSDALLDEPPSRRPQAADQFLKSTITASAPGPLVCGETDIWFEPSLELDPLALLRHASRITRLLVAWPGSYTNDALAYAVPKHSHYRVWKDPQAKVWALD